MKIHISADIEGTAGITNWLVSPIGIRRKRATPTIPRIREGADRVLNGNLKKSMLKLPRKYMLEIEYSGPVIAYRYSWYPARKHIGNRTIRFEARE